MRTIHGATEAVSGKATELLPLPVDQSILPVCPFELSRYLKDFNYCEYQGYYHTDITIPSEYFRPDIERPSEIGERHLDFTYLFDADINNPSNVTMGTGRRVRKGSNVLDLSKKERVVPQQRLIDRFPRLVKALGQ
jgi:hypothetical protein